MTIKDLNPRVVWAYFEEVTRVPRPSNKEEKIIKYLREFAESKGLNHKSDKAGNLLISKPATPGFEHQPTVVLQSHVDMVCEKNSDTEHNFETDPIQTVVDGEWLKAKGTTLGADNGIGIAAQLAVLASDDIQHGPVECLFTVAEETGLNGAFGLEKDFFTGNILLNLDSEEEGEVFIGCAGGIDSTVIFPYNKVAAPKDLFYFHVAVSKLKGGHSGDDIDKGYANANQLLARFLWNLNEKFGLTLVEISGGNLHNAIPREAKAFAAVPFQYREPLRIELNHFLADVEDEYKTTEPNLRIDLESDAAPEYCMDKGDSDKLISALYSCPNGVQAMSRAIPGLVETSTNFASVKMQPDNTIKIVTSQRSSVESAKYDIAHKVESIFKLIGATVTHGDGYPGWAPNTDSPILKVAVDIHKELFGF
ncbi:MAG: aminoacyl-histidine dipeptidase, partial [Bacteroidota bacterium]|nr:aminoacyl-histidine dipeptidase [Bacteroidota bacterium]